jgi:hypothetical protein
MAKLTAASAPKMSSKAMRAAPPDATRIPVTLPVVAQREKPEMAVKDGCVQCCALSLDSPKEARYRLRAIEERAAVP